MTDHTAVAAFARACAHGVILQSATGLRLVQKYQLSLKVDNYLSLRVLNLLARLVKYFIVKIVNIVPKHDIKYLSA